MYKLQRTLQIIDPASFDKERKHNSSVIHWSISSKLVSRLLSIDGGGDQGGIFAYPNGLTDVLSIELPNSSPYCPNPIDAEGQLSLALSVAVVKSALTETTLARVVSGFIDQPKSPLSLKKAPQDTQR
jgi:hypothetical protein